MNRYLEEGLLDGDHVPGAELLHTHAVQHRGNGRRFGVVQSGKKVTKKFHQTWLLRTACDRQYLFVRTVKIKKSNHLGPKNIAKFSCNNRDLYS